MRLGPRMLLRSPSARRSFGRSSPGISPLRHRMGPRSRSRRPRSAWTRSDLYLAFNLMVFDTTGPEPHAWVTTGHVRRAPIRGGDEVEIAEIPFGLSNGLQKLVVSSHAVVVGQVPSVEGGTGQILSLPKDGGTATVLASTKGRPYAMVTDDTNVYFTDEEGTKSRSVGWVARHQTACCGRQSPTVHRRSRASAALPSLCRRCSTAPASSLPRARSAPACGACLDPVE